MNTQELFFHMCDGRNSVNDIFDLLTACGHDRTDLMQALGAVLDDENATGTVNYRMEVVFNVQR